MTADATIIPELAVTDRTAATALLSRVFGFSDAGGGLLRLGSQTVALVGADAPAGHGKIDHLALSVADVDATLAALIARGAGLEATTPDGPREIAEFWGTGVRYAFLRGPEGARIELCARRGAGGPAGIAGHDHIGIPCTDIAASERFFRDLGLTPLAAVDLDRPEGVTHVRFLRHGVSVVELYGPPDLRGRAAPFAANALWRGLRMTGTGLAAGERTGPDGLRVTLL